VQTQEWLDSSSSRGLVPIKTESGISPDAVMEVNGGASGSFIRQVWVWICGIVYALCNPLYLDYIKDAETIEEELKGVKDDRDTLQDQINELTEELDKFRESQKVVAQDLHASVSEHGSEVVLEVVDDRYLPIPEPPGRSGGFYGDMVHVKSEPTLQQRMDRGRKSVMKIADRAREVFGGTDSDGSSA